MVTPDRAVRSRAPRVTLARAARLYLGRFFAVSRFGVAVRRVDRMIDPLRVEIDHASPLPHRPRLAGASRQAPQLRAL